MIRDTSFFTMEKLILNPLFNINLDDLYADEKIKIPVKYSLDADMYMNTMIYNKRHHYMQLNLHDDNDGKNPTYILKFRPFGFIFERRYTFVLYKLNNENYNYTMIMLITPTKYKRIDNQITVLNIIDDIVLRPKYYNGFESIIVDNINTRIMTLNNRREGWEGGYRYA